MQQPRFYPLRRLARDRRGNITMVCAGALTTLLGASAFAVDTGSIYLEQRRLQGIADAAALAAVAAPDDAEAAATAAIATGETLRPELQKLESGDYHADPDRPQAERFVIGDSGGNAVRVALARDTPLYFGRFFTGSATTRVTATATAARLDVASFAIGSRLASVDGGIANALLSALAGTDLGITAMGYDALVGADVDVAAFAEALRTELSLDGATFDETLSTSARLPVVLRALAASADSDRAADALRAMAARVPGTELILADIIDLGPLAQGMSGETIAVDTLVALREVLQLANGDRQIELELGGSASGLASARVRFAAGERLAESPWLAVGKDGDTIVRTAQSRLAIDVAIADTAGLSTIRLPILVELASAEARLSSISCAGGSGSASVTLSVRPSVGSLWIAETESSAFDDFTRALSIGEATLANAGLAKVKGRATVEMGGTTPQQLVFSPTDITERRTRTVSTNDIAQGIALSLRDHLDMRVETAGFAIPLTDAANTLGTVLATAAPAIDSLINRVARVLGVGVGEADLRIGSVRCGTPVLVA